MTEENINLTQVDTEESSNQMYIDEIEKLKSTTVSKDKYAQLMQENKNLLQSLVKGTTVTQAEEPKLRAASEIRSELFGKEHDNLGYAKLALELRDSVLAEEGKDIFVGEGHQITPTQESRDSAERFASVLEQCIDYANGDSEAFTNELQRRTTEINLPRYR